MITEFQIGKAGITEGVLLSLANAFKTHYQVRIHLLPSSGRTSPTMKTFADELCNKLPEKEKGVYRARIIGFTIILTKGKK
ncbi:MAG TPA: YhbY family RNA-binding protein [Candidatus Nanoarchaeia archaeon]|nr:YhbY family RNA-binding protein [Candidatus Nanoarchaeia archaeon]